MNERNVKIAAVVAAGAAVIAVIVLVFTTYTGGEDSEVANDSTTSFEGEEDPPPDGSDVQPEPRPTDTETEGAHDDEGELNPDETEAVVTTTTKFMQAWLKPGKTKQRQQAVEPFATSTFVEKMAHLDPDPLPTGGIKGEPTVVGGSNYTATTLVKLGDGSSYNCNLIFDTDGWRVAKVSVNTDDESGGPTDGAGEAGETGGTGEANGAGEDEQGDSGSEGGTHGAGDASDGPEAATKGP